MRPSESRGRYRWWLALACVTLAWGWVLDALGLSAGYLFGGLSIGIVAALLLPGRFTGPGGLPMREPLVSAALALTGVALGTQLTLESITTLGLSWISVSVVAALTIGLSFASGLVLSRRTAIDVPTAALGMVAGGGPSAVVMADELGADPRLVAFMQYIRVLGIVASMPLIVALLPAGDGAAGRTTAAVDATGIAGDWLLTVAVVAIGTLVAVVLRRSSASLLVGLGLSVVLLVAPGVGAFHVPVPLRIAAFAILGLDVGLRFTQETLRHIRSVLRPVLVVLTAFLVTCFLLGALLSVTTAIPLLDAYLATTPGGLSAVVAVTLGSGADPTLVFAAQTLRMLAALTLAPLVVQILVRLHETYVTREPTALSADESTPMQSSKEAQCSAQCR